MFDATLYLHRAAVCIGAEPAGAVFFADQGSAAVGTVAGKFRKPCVRPPASKVHACNLGDYFAALFKFYVIAYVYVQQGHLVLVVECCALDDSSSELNRDKIGYRSHRSSATYLIINAFQPRNDLFRLELVCYCPAWELGGIAQFPLRAEFVYLDHDSVGRERQFSAGAVPVMYIVLDLVDVAADLAVFAYRQAPGSGLVEGFRMGRESDTLRGYVIKGADEPSLRHLVRITQLERAGSCIARVCEGLLSVKFALTVEFAKCAERHQDLAPDFQFIRKIAVQPVRDGSNPERVGGHIVALDSISAGKRLMQNAFLVAEADSNAVELELTAVAERFRLQDFVRPKGKFFNLSYAVSVAQREHGIAVGPLDEAFADGAGERAGVGKVRTYPGGRGVGAGELRKRRLQRLEFVHQHIKLIIADNR